jgi:hypothetical protein
VHLAGVRVIKHMKNAFLLRAPDKNSAIILMRDTLAVIHVELQTPFTPQQFINAQSVHALNPVPTDVELGLYDMDRTRFTQCRVTVDIPEVKHTRVDYSSRRRKAQ